MHLTSARLLAHSLGRSGSLVRSPINLSAAFVFAFSRTSQAAMSCLLTYNRTSCPSLSFPRELIIECRTTAFVTTLVGNTPTRCRTLKKSERRMNACTLTLVSCISIVNIPRPALHTRYIPRIAFIKTRTEMRLQSRYNVKHKLAIKITVHANFMI